MSYNNLTNKNKIERGSDKPRRSNLLLSKHQLWAKSPERVLLEEMDSINCLRDKISEWARLEDPYHIAFDVVGTLVITLVFYIIIPGKLLPFIYSWVVWEIFILSLARNYYDPIRRFVIVISSIILYILLEVVRSSYKRKAFF